MKPNTDRATPAVAVREPEPATRRIRLVRPGVRACGEYRAGEEYDVSAAEAARLVAHKGFVYVDGQTVPPPTTEDQEH